LNLTVIDIGQGMAMLIETAHHRMLYDTGPAYSPTSNAGSRIIYPYLTMRGIDHLDGMMISHNDNDHSGGALSLLEQVPVDWVSTSLDMQSKVVQISDEKSHHVRCVAGQEWDWDGVHFELLHPVPAVYESGKWKSNAKSCTLKITNGMHTVLLAGDIEATQEDELANSVAEKLNSTVLLVPHHGSGTSSTAEFLAAVQPKIALFQLGYHNRYHHPKAEVWQRYADLGSTRLRTDRDGAITINVADEVQFETYRQSHARYWYPTDAVD
jgi:competence protein ComEC